jgi:hypothetical protein
MPFATLTPDQRNAALKKAVFVRGERARIKKELKSGDVDLLTVLDINDVVLVGRMKVLTLLESLPGYGKVRARKLLHDLGIAEIRRVQGLTPRQRGDLTKYFTTV